MIRIAFVKFGGLANGGTEKYLQNIAMSLPKDQFDVTYFYCDAAPYIGADWKHPDTDPVRQKLMEQAGIRLVKFNVEAKDITNPIHTWVNTDFWSHFKEEDFDIVQSGIAGHREYPFYLIKNTPIVHSIHLTNMWHNQDNIAAIVHVSNHSKEAWINAGSPSHKHHVIYPSIQSAPEKKSEGVASIRKTIGLTEDTIIFGMHQRVDDGIWSPIPLQAYAMAQADNTAFVILGGSDKYAEQATLMGLHNFIQLEPTADQKAIWGFLAALDVYCHGRADGENNSQCIGEAMAMGLPIISHQAPSMGQAEQIGDIQKDGCGIVAVDWQQYGKFMMQLTADATLRKELSLRAKARWQNLYSPSSINNKWVELYTNIVQTNKVYRADDQWLNDWVGEEEEQ